MYKSELLLLAKEEEKRNQTHYLIIGNKYWFMKKNQNYPCLNPINSNGTDRIIFTLTNT